MPGACCTRGLVCNDGERCAHEHTGTAGALRHSLRNGLTAYAALSLETNSFCLHPAGLMAERSGWIDFATGSLTSATDARTTRFCRTLRLRKRLRRIKCKSVEA